MKILIIKTSSLGDIIQSFPVLAYLKEKFDASVEWVVEKECSAVLHSHPLIDQLHICDTRGWKKSLFSKTTFKSLKQFLFKLRQKKFDIIFDLQGNLKSGIFLAATLGKKKVGFSLKSVREWPNVLFTNHKISIDSGKSIQEDYLGVVKGYFNDNEPYQPTKTLFYLKEEEKIALANLTGEKAALVCPGSAWPNKRLSFETLVSVLKKLQRKKYLLAWGSEEERRFCQKIAAAIHNAEVLPRLTIPLLQHIMSKSSLVIAMDSFALHLCATTQTPTLSFFGPTNSKKFAPAGPGHLAIQGTCPYNVRFKKTCPRLRTCKTGACIKNISLQTLSEETLI